MFAGFQGLSFFTRINRTGDLQQSGDADASSSQAASDILESLLSQLLSPDGVSSFTPSPYKPCLDQGNYYQPAPLGVLH